MNRLKEKFIKEITPALMSKFNYKSVMQVPKIEKIVINMGVGDAVQTAKALDVAVEELNNNYRSKTCCNSCEEINRWFPSS